MKTYDINQKLAKNFTLREVVNWPQHQVMTEPDKAKATDLALKALNATTLDNAIRVAQFLQSIRDEMNAAFPEYNGRLGLRVMSWLRAKAWELYRKRSGNSQHTTGHAVDIIVIGASATDYPRIMEWIWNRYQEHNGGLARLFRNGRWSFIHFDYGVNRRWEY